MVLTPLLLSLFSAVPLPPSQEQDASPEVRLIVLLSVDQLIPEQLERLAPHFRGGFARFLKGERHRLAFHDHAHSSTGPGHATLGTGLWPSHSGIVGNTWTERDRGDTFVYCVGDSSVAPVNAEGPGRPGSAGRSPKWLLADGLADYLEQRSPESRTLGIAGKDRAAILSTGRDADLALWWDGSGGTGFMSSTHYGQALPDWVLAFDAAWREELPKDGWTPLDASLDPRLGTSVDSRPGEAPRPLPLALPDVSEMEEDAANRALGQWVFSTPWVDLLSIELAERALDALEFGSDEHVDYLFLGLSGCDITGHSYGPRSLAVTDLLLRDDAALGRLFARIDERVGADHWIAALSSDHGVLPLPEPRVLRGFDTQRLPQPALQRAARELGQITEEAFGVPCVKGMTETGILLDRDVLDAADVSVEDVAALARERRDDWLPSLHALFTVAEVEGADTGLARLLAHSTLPGRSPDLSPVLDHGTLSGFPSGTSHGTPWEYDRHVPLLFLGPGSTPGSDWRPCATVDVLPTLLARAGLPVPSGLDGEPLP